MEKKVKLNTKVTLEKLASLIKEGLGDVSKKINKVEVRMSSLEDHVVSIEKTVGSLKNTVGSLEDTVGSLEDRVVSIEDVVDKLAVSTLKGFQGIDRRFNEVEENFKIVRRDILNAGDRFVSKEEFYKRISHIELSLENEHKRISKLFDNK